MNFCSSNVFKVVKEENEKDLVNLSGMEYGVKLWGPEGRLQENDRISKKSSKDIMKVHRLCTTNIAK